MSDIVAELRERALRAEQDGEPIALLDEAADEITRLRGDAEVARLRMEAARGEIEKLQHRVRFQDSVIRSGDVATLTDAEREAIERACRVIASTLPYGSQRGAEDYQTLRGLLKRMSPTTT